MMTGVRRVALVSARLRVVVADDERPARVVPGRAPAIV